MSMPDPRQALYDQLTKVLGPGPAETMMSYLPDSQPATKDDLAEVRSELHADITRLRTEVRADIAELRTDVRIEIREFRTDLRHLHDMLAAQTRVHVAASLGSAVTVAGLVFIAAQIV